MDRQKTFSSTIRVVCGRISFEIHTALNIALNTTLHINGICESGDVISVGNLHRLIIGHIPISTHVVVRVTQGLEDTMNKVELKEPARTALSWKELPRSTIVTAGSSFYIVARDVTVDDHWLLVDLKTGEVHELTAETDLKDFRIVKPGEIVLLSPMG